MVLAQAFYGSYANIRSLILGLAASPQFPRDEIAATMVEIQPIIETQPKIQESHIQTDHFYIPSMSVAQSEKLDEVLNKLRVIILKINDFNLLYLEV